jgi:hypothetical protein
MRHRERRHTQTESLSSESTGRFSRLDNPVDDAGMPRWRESVRASDAEASWNDVLREFKPDV